MRSEFKRPSWWQLLAAAFALGALFAGVIVWLADGNGTESAETPVVVEEQPPIELEITWRPEEARAESARLICGPDRDPRATGRWEGAAEAACNAAYAAAPALLEEPTRRENCAARRTSASYAFRVAGFVNSDPVDRVFDRRTECAEEDWQAARALIDPWLDAVEGPELDEGRTQD